MKRLLLYGTMAALVVLMGLLVRIAPARMPQALVGGDILSVLLGDAKKDISSAMLHEADSYFHGGVDIDCHHLHGHDHDHDHECDHNHQHGHDHEHGFDPWRWINTHIRAPEIDRHLEGDKAVEMMPWFWVAIKSDPHNVQAWSAAWYAALYIMGDETLALRIAVDGHRHNPESLELAGILGRSYRAEHTRNPEKSEAMFRSVVELAGKMGELDDGESLAFFNAVGYLAVSAKNRKDAKDLAALLKAARRINPSHPTTDFIANSLNEIKSACGL